MWWKYGVAVGLFLLFSGSVVHAAKHRGATLYAVTVEVLNAATTKGSCHDSMWVGIHDERFDFSGGNALERVASDGDTHSLVDVFAYSRGGGIDGIIGSTPLCSQDYSDITFVVNARSATELFLSYASVVVVDGSNAVFANNKPDAHLIFNDDGEFEFESFTIDESEVVEVDGDAETDSIKRNLSAKSKSLRHSRVADEKVGTAEENDTKPEIVVNVDAVLISNEVTAKMRGKYVGPYVRTNGRGSATLSFLSNGDIAYRVTLSSIDEVLLVKMQVESSEEDRNFLAMELCDGSELVEDNHGALTVEGHISSKGFRNGEFERLWQNARSGMVYVTVVTKKYPRGEIRGGFR